MGISLIRVMLSFCKLCTNKCITLQEENTSVSNDSCAASELTQNVARLAFDLHATYNEHNRFKLVTIIDINSHDFSLVNSSA